MLRFGLSPSPGDLILSAQDSLGPTLFGLCAGYMYVAFVSLTPSFFQYNNEHLGASLYGVLVAQTMTYLRSCRQDRLIIKTIVRCFYIHHWSISDSPYSPQVASLLYVPVNESTS